MWILTSLYKKQGRLGSLDWSSPRALCMEKGAPLLLAKGKKKVQYETGEMMASVFYR